MGNKKAEFIGVGLHGPFTGISADTIIYDSPFEEARRMKLIRVEAYDSLKSATIIESHYDTKQGWVGLDEGAVCFVCGEVNPFAVLLKDIDDGCMDDIICAQCIDELKNRLDVLRGLR